MGGMPSALLSIIIVDGYPHPPCKQTLTVVVVVLVTAIIVLSIIH
jgi:hypothetical protein